MLASVRQARLISRRRCGLPAISARIGLSASNIIPISARSAISCRCKQVQQLFAVTDFKLNTLDVELGAGYGLTPGSDRLVFKAIIGYAFPVPGRSDSNGSSPNVPLAMGTCGAVHRRKSADR